MKFRLQRGKWIDETEFLKEHAVRTIMKKAMKQAAYDVVVSGTGLVAVDWKESKGMPTIRKTKAGLQRELAASQRFAQDRLDIIKERNQIIDEKLEDIRTLNRELKHLKDEVKTCRKTVQNTERLRLEQCEVVQVLERALVEAAQRFESMKWKAGYFEELWVEEHPGDLALAVGGKGANEVSRG